MDILHQKHNYEQKLSSMIYGLIEVRTKDLNNISIFIIEKTEKCILNTLESIQMIYII